MQISRGSSLLAENEMNAAAQLWHVLIAFGHCPPKDRSVLCKRSARSSLTTALMAHN